MAATTARHALEQLLDLLFARTDLQRFVESHAGVTVTDGATSPVEALLLQDAVSAALFDRLLAEFPQRAAEIEQVARQWIKGRARADVSPAPSAAVQSDSGAWDIFLAYAAPDAPAAQALYRALADTGSGLDVFLDSRCVQLGQRWDDVIPAALDASRLVVVLVSGKTRDAWYTREEIALAIDAGRGRGAPGRPRPLVIPVYLDRMPEGPSDWIYGLRRLHGIVVEDAGGLIGVATRLIARLDALDDEAPEPTGHPAVAPAQTPQRQSVVSAQSPLTETNPAAAPITALQYLHLAMDLDRSDQWLALLRESRSDRSGCFLLHGERRQNLELFVARLWHYLSEETDRHHRIIQVPERWEAELPRSDAAWEINLRHAFPRGQGTAADLLAESARHGPVFLIIGRHPLSRDGLDDDEAAITALESFLEGRLPELIAGCPGPHPVRALLATDYERSGASLAERFRIHMRRGAERCGIAMLRLPEVKPVTWDHVQAYLDTLNPPAPDAVYRAVEQAYLALDHERISFRDLAERLSRRL